MSSLRDWQFVLSGGTALVRHEGRVCAAPRAALEGLARRDTDLDGLARSLVWTVADVASHDVEAPLCMGDYVLTDHIGSGGFGVVFGARDVNTQERVAIKVLRSDSSQPFRWFKEEGRVLADVSHPALVSPDEIVQTGRHAGLVMPFVEGVDFCSALAEALGPSGPVRDAEAARALIVQLADALVVMHDRGILHLDLKPENVLVGAGPSVHLMDFGLAAEASAFTDGEMSGTPEYMAPEVVLRGQLGPASDAYALGAMIHRAFVGRVPFGDQPDPLIARTLMPAPDIRDARPEVDAAWAELCLRLLEPEPERRAPIAEVLAWAGAKPSSAPRREAFVGRGAALDRLMHAWSAVRDGAPPMLLEILGASGIGKTELVRQLAANVGAAHVLWGRCYEREAIPFKALDQVVASLLDRVRASPTASAALAEHPDRGALTRVFPLALPDAGVEVEPAAHDREHAGRVVRDLIGHLAREHPILLVIDDAQWGDIDSADLLATVLSPPRAPRVLVVVTRRTDTGRGPFLESLHDRVRRGVALRIVELPLDALAPTDAGSLLAAARVPEERRAAIGVIAAGNPFLLQLLAHGGAATDLASVVRERLEALPATLRTLAWGAAAAGSSVALRALALACEVAVPTRRELSLLAARGLVRTASGETGRSLVLAHDRLREVLLAARSADDERRFHGRLARALATLGADAGTIARHLVLAGEADAAVEHALEGAAAAERVSAYGRAAELLAIAVESGRADPEGQLRARLAHALRECGQGRKAANVWSELGRELAASERASTWRERAGEALLESGAIDEGMTVLEANLARLGEAGPKKGRRALMSLGWSVLRTLVGRGRLPIASRGDAQALERADACWAAGKCVTFLEPPSGIELLFRALQHAQRGGDRRRVARLQGILAGTVLGLAGPTRGIAVRWLDAVEALGRELDDRYFVANALLWRTLMDLSHGKLDAVVHGGMRAIELLGTVADTAWERHQAASFVMRALTMRGDYTTCAAMSEVYRRDMQRRDDLYGEMLFGGYATIPAIARGELEVARRTSEWLRTSWMPGAYTIQRFCAMMYDAWCDVLEGAPERAAERLVADRARFTSAGLHRIIFSRMDWNITEARIGLASPGRLRGLREPAKIAAELRREKGPDAIGHAALIEGVVSARAGRHDVARVRFDEAIGCFGTSTVAVEARALELRLAQWDRDEARCEDARASLRDLGVHDPEAWTDFIARAAP